MEALKREPPRIKRPQLVYKRPYEDRWGELHDPTTWWDELLKYYRPHEILQVSQACRRMAQPAHTGAIRLIRAEQRRHRRYAARIDGLEAQYLESTNRKKYWKRRKRRMNKVRVVSNNRGLPPAHQR